MATTVTIPEQTGGARPGAGPARQSRRRFRFGPLLPARLRPASRPILLLEIALIGIGYYCYRLTQDAATAGRVAPYNRGHAILRVERWLHIDIEHWLNRTVDGHAGWLVVGMNYYYATLHFLVPIGLLIWVYRRHPEKYRAVRSVVMAATLLALIGFYFYALTPPRLLIPAGTPGAYIDTVCEHHTWGKTVCDGVGGLDGTLANQYAAMPSVHIAWATWSGLVVAQLARRRWVKALGVMYPFATLTVILVTGNHYLLDAVGGLAVLGAGFLVQRLLHGRWAFAAVPPATATGDGPAPADSLPAARSESPGSAPVGSPSLSSAPPAPPRTRSSPPR